MDRKGRRSEMRFWMSVSLASSADMGLLLAWSCGPTDVTCEDTATCPKPQDAGTEESAADTADVADSSEAEAPVEAEADVACMSTLPPTTDGGCLNESIAIFVSPKGNDGASGKRGAELRTIGAALRAS